MSVATYWQRGESLDYYNDGTETIEAGTILELGSYLGVAAADIDPEETGAVHVTGVYSIPKTSENEITIGTQVYYDGSGIAESGTSVIGYAAETSAAGEETILVKLIG